MNKFNNKLDCLKTLKTINPNCEEILTMKQEIIISMFCECVALYNIERKKNVFSVLFYSISRPNDDITMTFLDVFLEGLYPANTGIKQLDNMSNTFFSMLTKKESCIVLESLKTLFSITNRLEDNFARKLLSFWEALSNSNLHSSRGCRLSFPPNWD